MRNIVMIEGDSSPAYALLLSFPTFDKRGAYVLIAGAP
jgi:hypothetical protein